jgi:hypothetical protein
MSSNMFDGFIKIVEIYTVFLFKLIKYRSCQIKQLPLRDHNLTPSHEKNTTDTSSVNLIKIRPLTCFTDMLLHTKSEETPLQVKCE